MKLRLFLLAILAPFALVALAPNAGAEVTVDELPELAGDVFAGEFTDGLVVIITIDETTYTEYIFDPQEKQLTARGRQSIEPVSGGWELTIDEDTIEFNWAGVSDTLHVDSIDTGLEWVDYSASSSTIPVIQYGSGVPGGCLGVCVVGGCCPCCICVHRALGIPEIVDSICCWFVGGC